MRKVADLPNGHELFVEETEQGRRYLSEETGIAACVWHTVLTDESTLLAAIVEERRQQTKERHERAQQHREHLTELLTGQKERHEI